MTPRERSARAVIYLGDSVYAEMETWGDIVLTTRNGLPTDPSNRIVLEPSVYASLVLWARQAHPAAAPEDWGHDDCYICDAARREPA